MKSKRERQKEILIDFAIAQIRLNKKLTNETDWIIYSNRALFDLAALDREDKEK